MIPERVSPVRFAAALARRLNSVVPAGLAVRAQGAGVTLYDPASWGPSLAAEHLSNERGQPMAQLVESVAWTIMNAIQDEVMESTKDQWPLGPKGAAEPEARVIDGQLHLWFGDRDAPILRLDPLDLSDVSDDRPDSR